jgi:hypothetical protein
MQLAGRYTTLGAPADFAYWSPFFASEAEAKEFCHTAAPRPDGTARCMAAAAQAEAGHAPLTPEEIARLRPEVAALFLPKAGGGMVTTQIVETGKKTLPFAFVIGGALLLWFFGGGREAADRGAREWGAAARRAR